jgi:protein import protein ZIM17
VEGQDGSSDILVDLKARMHIAFTCKICGTRSAHEMTKIAYTQGVVLVQCPGCEKQHLIADNLGWFGKDKQNIETILADKDERVRRTTNGNIEVLDHALPKTADE